MRLLERAQRLEVRPVAVDHVLVDPETPLQRGILARHQYGGSRI